MITYSQFKPTSFDSHISLEGKESWFVFPCARNRDSDSLEESNFHCGLEKLGGEGEDVEVHRFGHWANGWFEIIVIRPKTEAAKSAVKLESKLEDYPLLNEDDYCERRYEAGEYDEEAGEFKETF